MGKVQIDNVCCLTEDIKNLFLHTCFNSPVCFFFILSKSFNLIGCHGNIKDIFSKILLLNSHGGDEAET